MIQPPSVYLVLYHPPFQTSRDEKNQLKYGLFVREKHRSLLFFEIANENDGGLI